MLTLVFLGLLLVCFPFQAGAQLCFYWEANMRASEVVPPAGSEARAECLFSFSSCGLCSEQEDDYFVGELWRLRNFTGVPEAWQIRSGAAGENGTILYETTILGQSPPIIWETVFDPDQCTALHDTLLYVVIISDLFPEGEARGQLILQPLVATVRTTWGRIRGQFR